MILYLLLAILLVIFYQTTKKNEQFSAYGSLIQLYNKDYQDSHLTDGTTKYYPCDNYQDCNKYYFRGYRPELRIPDYLTNQ